MSALLQDIRFTFRQWRRSPGFVAVAVVTIAFGIGGVTTVLSVANATFLRSRRGVRGADALVEIRVGDRTGRRRHPMSYAAFQALRASDLGLSGLAGESTSEVSLSTPGSGAELVAGMAASGNYFTLLGTRAVRGRLFTTADDRPTGAGHVVVLSYRYWTRRFAKDASVLGRTVTINRVPFTVIGVAEDGFQGHLPLYDFDLFVPLGATEVLAGLTPEARSRSPVFTIGRLAPGASMARVREGTRRAAEELRKSEPGAWASVFVVEPYANDFQQFRGPVALFFLFLVALSGCILFIACTNVAGALVARAVSRSRELAVRLAVGAARTRLVAQLLTESMLLFLFGGVLGIVLATWATSLLGHWSLPLPVPLTSDVTPDPRVFGVSLLMTMAAGGAFGIAPALRAMRADVASVLKGHRRLMGGRPWLRQAFVVAQIAGVVAVLACSGVLLRALDRAAAIDLGMEPRGLHVATVNLGIQQYSEARGRAFFSALREGAAGLPGVEAAALTDFVPLVSPPERSGIFTNPAGDAAVEAGIVDVSSGFFETVHTPILAGRPFGDADIAGGEPVAIVNELVARILWPGQDPLGKTLRSGDATLRVVGVAREGKYISLGESPLAVVFRPRTQVYVPTTSLVVRTRERPDIGRDLEKLVRTLDPQVPLSTNAPYARLVAVSLLPRKAAALFAGLLGGLGLFLALVGLYGVLTSRVALRAGELALRTALGAPPVALRTSVLREGLGLVLLGLLLGVPLAVGVTSLIRRFLFGLAPADPITFATIAVLFGIVGLAASYVPAARATRTDPMQALRAL